MKRIKYWALVDAGRLEVFRSGVLEWYYRYGRDLPWRNTTDPYAILVSEIMLHQTTVTTVTPIYQTFMAAFPTVEALNAAPLVEVKAITDPLGYKVRGRWLKDIAEIIVQDRHGIWPTTVEGLMALPGIGRYTAGAVVSFAFKQDAPILDTNVKRVLGRYFGINFKNTEAETQHHLWALADAVVPLGGAGHFNQALMDFGAMLCTARKPACIICPVFSDCQSAAGGESLNAAEEGFTYTITPRKDDGASSPA